VAFNQQEGESFLKRLSEEGPVEEALLVSTCNRTELYVVYEPDPKRPMDRFLIEKLRQFRNFEPSEKCRNFEVHRNEEAVKHLFRVAGGLDSQILGESQILGQVKSSMPWAQSAETAGRTIRRLWERALRVGKRVRTETAIGDGAISASYAALGLARKVFGTLDNKNVAIIGTGEIGLLALESLKGVPLGSLTLLNRTRSVADELAEKHGGGVRDLEELPDALVEADLVISSTGSREPLIRYEQMRKVRQRRGGDRPLLIVDLAIPRDFDEACGALEDVFLKNLDDLTEIVQANIAERHSEIPRAEAIIEREVANFFRWRQGLELEPTIRKVRELFHTIRDEELQALDAHLEREHFTQVDRFTQRLVNRLLHVLASNLRRHDGLRDQELMHVIHQILTEEIPHPEERSGDS
jgi:glutamyl-tRNA reductase